MQSGAIVPGATLTLTNRSHRASWRRQSPHRAETTPFEQVNPGSYSLRVNAKGFQSQITHGIQVHVQGQRDTGLPPYRVGNVSEQLTVTASTPLLQAESASIAQIVDSKAN